MPDFLTTPVPHSEGAAFIRSKPAVTRAIFDALAPELQARAFLITGVESLDVVARVRDLTARLPEGGDYEELKGQILDELSPWLVTATDPEERQKQISAAHRRAELLLRMHGWQAYARSQDAMMRANSDVFPYRQYLSSEDARVRPTHAALNKKILPSDHPFWETHTPPWEFGCRCDCVAMTQEDVDAIKAAEQSKPVEDRLVIDADNPQLAEIEKNGRLLKPGGQGFLDIRTPRERTGEGYEWRPADDALSIDQILERFTPAERQAFADYAAKQTLDDGRTLADWWQMKPAVTPPVAGPAPATVPAAIPPPPAATRVPVSAALEVKARAAGPIREAIALIDQVHGDGVLPKIPVTGSPGPDSSGSFLSFSNGVASEIKVRVTGPWPRITTAHEVGHFLDLSGIGTPGKWTAGKAGPLEPIIDALRQTPTFQQISAAAANRAYYESARELWARAYAQFIAVESGDPAMLAELDKIRTSPAPWRHWPDAEFEPARDLIRKLFQSLNWL